MKGKVLVLGQANTGGNQSMKVEGGLMILLDGMEKLTSLEGLFPEQDLKPGDTNRLVQGAC